jgi:hypothetical protein
MAEVTDAPQVVNREGKKMYVVLIEVSNDFNTREIVGTATKLRLRILIVPVDCGSRVRRDIDGDRKCPAWKSRQWKGARWKRSVRGSRRRHLWVPPKNSG